MNAWLIAPTKRRSPWPYAGASCISMRTIRPLALTHAGVHVGEPLRSYRGILTGVPVPVDHRAAESA